MYFNVNEHIGRKNETHLFFYDSVFLENDTTRISNCLELVHLYSKSTKQLSMHIYRIINKRPVPHFIVFKCDMHLIIRQQFIKIFHFCCELCAVIGRDIFYQLHECKQLCLSVFSIA